MTHKKDWHNNKDDLKKKLEEARNIADNKEEENHNNEQEKKIIELEKNLAEKTEIARKAQYDYINLKMDFDWYVKRKEENSNQEKIDTLISVIQKFLPFIESLRKSIDNIPQDKREETIAQGIILTYNKFINTLESMDIKQIESIGIEPNNELHEPISMVPTEDKKMKWKIIQEFERWYYYEKNWIKKIINTSKVVVWQ